MTRTSRRSCPNCGEEWPREFLRLVGLAGCPACNPAWREAVPAPPAE